MKTFVGAMFATTLLLAGVPAQASPPNGLIDQSGPLPIQAHSQTGSVGPATLVVSGSVWTPTKDTMIGIEVLLDGMVVGTAKIYSNAPNTHRAVVTQHIPISLDKPFDFSGDTPIPPTYTIELRAMNADTQSDFNDHYSVSLFE